MSKNSFFSRLKSAVASVAAVAMAASMVAGSAAPVMAENESITIQTDENGHTYEAYQIFKGDLASGTLSNIQWGDGFNSEKASEFINELKADDTFKVDGTNIFANATSAETVASALNDQESDGTIARKFADIVSTYLSTDTTKKDTTSTFVEAVTEPEAVAAHYTINLTHGAGYYFVKEDSSKYSTTETTNTETKYILKVLGSETVTAKNASPTVDKKVKENSTNAWQYVADANEQEEIEYKLIATLPKKSVIDSYNNAYYAQLSDTLSSGLDFISVENIYLATTADAASDATGSVDIKTDTTNVVTNESDIANKAGQTFTVTISDVKNLTSYTSFKTDASNYIIVIYKAKMNASAVVGNAGNENHVTLKYSHDPNTQQEGYTTPAHYVHVFTFELDVTKINSNGDAITTADAEFKLQNSNTSSTYSNKWAVLENGKISSWADDENSATVLKPDSTGKFTVTGLDAGDYTLKETKAPAGYTIPTNPTFKVTIAATETNDATSANQKVTALKIKNSANNELIKSATSTSGKVTAIASDGDNGALDTGIVAADIVNKTSSELPSTGGAGRFIYMGFGAAGLAMVIALLAVKRRKRA